MFGAKAISVYVIDDFGTEIDLLPVQVISRHVPYWLIDFNRAPLQAAEAFLESGEVH